jgi:hypothetical protein
LVTNCTLSGELERGRAIFDEVLATAGAFQLKNHVEYALENVGNISTLEGDYAGPRAQLCQRLVLGRELGDHHLLLYILGELTELEAALGMSERAAKLGGVVSEMRLHLGAPMAPAEDGGRESHFGGRVPRSMKQPISAHSRMGVHSALRPALAYALN